MTGMKFFAMYVIMGVVSSLIRDNFHLGHLMEIKNTLISCLLHGYYFFTVIIFAQPVINICK